MLCFAGKIKDFMKKVFTVSYFVVVKILSDFLKSFHSECSLIGCLVSVENLSV